jgi:hypothetical protein
VSEKQASRQDRQQSFQPYVGPVATLLSQDAHAYTDGVAGQQAKYANAGEYNGEAARGRERQIQ